ncbi:GLYCOSYLTRANSFERASE [Salix viminalis]|uniref:GLYCOSYLTRANSFERASE n=1 Tax=Salix viminalis TaxID=40686 RepID=A0A9Q0NIM8_SALVM|nr:GLYCOSYLTRANSFERASE [Salix viminalis]
MSSTQQRTTQAAGFRKTITWFFIIVGTLYLVYSSHLILNNDRRCLTTEENLEHLTNLSTSIQLNEQDSYLESPPLVLSQKSQRYNTELKHIVFGIAASADLWQKRKEYVKLWWRPKQTRGIVWMDRQVGNRSNEGLPQIRISADTSRFKYSNKKGHRSALRISRVYDVYGDLLGLLAAHPVAPLASLHHIDVVQPIFPGMSRARALQHLFNNPSAMTRIGTGPSPSRGAMLFKSGGGVVSPRELETPARTFLNWYRKADYTAYTFNTRPVTKHPCMKPFVFYMSTSKYDRARKQAIGVYTRRKSPSPYCRWKMASPERIDSVVVLKRPDTLRWLKLFLQSPRRDCCRVLPTNKASTMYLWVGNCRDGEISEFQRP